MKMVDVANAARGRWISILPALGADVKFLKNIHGPCPFCGGKDRFRFSDDGEGRWICGQCGHGDGFDYLVKLNNWDLTRTKKEVTEIAGAYQASPSRPEQDPEAKARYMKTIWTEASRVTPGDPVWLYLSSRCGDPSAVIEDLRYHPALAHSVSKTQHPAMLARMRSVDGRRGIGIHRTYLTSGGQKAQVDPVRMSYGDMGTVRLGPILGAAIGVAEGIETAICAGHLFGLPVWSTICASGMQAWDPPPGIESVMICGDNDDSCTGQAAAWGLAKRLRVMGLAVSVRIPKLVGEDWADQQMERVS